MNYLITEDGLATLDDMKARLDALAPFSNRTDQGPDDNTPVGPVRGYLMQPISSGGSGLCALVSRRQEYRSWKIDLIGILIENTTSSFKLRFSKGIDPVTQAKILWFDTERLPVLNLTIQKLISAISTASILNNVAQIPQRTMLGGLGHPVQATNLVPNDDLYPILPTTYKVGDLIDSKIASWIFSIPCAVTLVGDPDYDIDLLFTLEEGLEPVQLDGPAVMTIQEISDTPTGETLVVTDIMDLPRPTPLQGGSKIVATPFADIGYGIIAAYPRDLFMEQES